MVMRCCSYLTESVCADNLPQVEEGAFLLGGNCSCLSLLPGGAVGLSLQRSARCLEADKGFSSSEAEDSSESGWSRAAKLTLRVPSGWSL